MKLQKYDWQSTLLCPRKLSEGRGYYASEDVDPLLAELETLREEREAMMEQEPYCYASLNREDFSYSKSHTETFVGHGWKPLFERPLPAQQMPDCVAAMLSVAPKRPEAGGEYENPYDSAGLCALDVGDERTKAFEVFENIRVATRVGGV